MRRQLNAYEEGIASLSLLFVPINIGNTHWIFLCVIFESKRIELYNSQGKKPTNKGYMETMRRFLYDEFHKGTPVEDRPPYDVWKREWKYSDRSLRCPRQQNDDDCGIFVLVSIYLMSRQRHKAHIIDVRPEIDNHQESTQQHCPPNSAEKRAGARK